MMTLRAVHAGSGYRYLLRSVATNDADPDVDSEIESTDRLSEYYAAKGTPAGRWRGAGLSTLNSGNIIDGAEIDEDQMAALYGEGLHPDADQMIADGASIKDTRLGRAYSIYTDDNPVLVDLAAAEKNFRTVNDRRPNEEERSELAQQIGRKHFADAHGGAAPVDNREVIAWVNQLQDTTRQAVAGYDLTFSPVKSVSTLWGLADREMANKIAAAHHEAVAEALQWVEDSALFTRVGVNGIQQLKTDGVLASEFTHFDTRGGDPDLHSHVLVSNKVRVSDTVAARKAKKVGEWKTIDGQQFFEHMHNASGVYNTALQQRLTDQLGLEFEAVDTAKQREPVWEVSGVPQAVNKLFSSRREEARPIYEQLVADYVAKHKRNPSARADYRLWQTAILETRDAKKPAESLDTLRSQWRDKAKDVLSEEQIDGLFSTATGVEVARPVFTNDDVETVAERSIDAVLSRRASFKRSHVHTAVSQQLRGYRFTDNQHRQDTYNAVMSSAVDDMSVCLTPPEILELPDALTTEADTGIDRKNNSEIYSTATQLEREHSILGAADKIAPAFVPDKKIAKALDRFTKQRGFSLNAGQEDMARHFLNAGTQLAVAVGPAGTGKTTSMEVVADLWSRERRGQFGEGKRSVIGLAPSASAAEILQADIGTESRTIDSLTYAWDQSAGQGMSTQQRLDSLPVAVRSGDMLLLDEAGMASTERLGSLVEIADASGAVIRMVGDPAQLDAVETGGVFRTLANAKTTPQLTNVMRMGDDTAQANATLKIRGGDVDGLDLYMARNWVADGTRADMLTQAVDGYLNDTEVGLRSMVIAPTNADTIDMNQMIQAAQIANGTVDPDSAAVSLSDGLQAHVGDTVLARKNKLIGRGRDGVRVLNGQVLTVRGVRADGSLDAFDPRSRTAVHLPADYVADNTQLGYATTVHRSQGATVDTTHSLVDAKLDRNGLYVALTRGKRSNKLYVDTTTTLDDTAEDAHVHHSGDEAAPSAEHILHGIVNHDHTQLSAVDEISEQLEQADSPDRIKALYVEGVARATDGFVTEVTGELIDSLPMIHAAGVEADEDGRDAIAHAGTYATNRGVDVRELWLDATDDIEWADSPGRLIASRLRRATDQHVATTERLEGTFDGELNVDNLDTEGRTRLDAAVADATRKGIDLDTIWDRVTTNVEPDSDAAGTIADNLTEVADAADDPRELIETWLRPLTPEQREAFRRSSLDHSEAAEAVGEATREGLDIREIWYTALADADWSDTPAADVTDTFRHMTQQAMDSTDPDNDDTGPSSGDDQPAEHDRLPVPPPTTAGSDPELAVWLDTTYDELTAAPADEDASAEDTNTTPDTDDTVQAGERRYSKEELRALWDSTDFSTSGPQSAEESVNGSESHPTHSPGYSSSPDHGPGW